MKPYPQVNVELTYRNYGTSWMCILRGATDNVEQVFNGLYNYCATHGNLDIQDSDDVDVVGIFWTDRNAMRRFFFNRYFMPRCNGNGKGQLTLAKQAMRFAYGQLELVKVSHEKGHTASRYMPDIFSVGVICAERPDSDMKDAILANAFKEKETVAHKVIDTE